MALLSMREEGEQWLEEKKLRKDGAWAGNLLKLDRYVGKGELRVI